MNFTYFHDYCIFENGDIYNSRGKKLTHTIKKGRKEITLTVGIKKRRTFVSARLIYCVFNQIDIDTFDKNQCVTFKNGNKLDISLDNLYCVFRGDLIQGQKHKRVSKLTDEQVEEIRRKYEETRNNKPHNQYDKKAPYNSYRSLAKEYNVEFSQIRHIVKGYIRNEELYKLKR